ncbi:MAG: NFACT family protein [Candidatus Micrarchaeota archaeon]|nr:NFACT family protein [Candidatus Micrarchaeota archaeon]
MHELTALELGLVVNELKPKVEKGFLKKFYDLGNGSFKMVFYREGVNTIVYCKLCVTINETKFSEEAGAATDFAMGVRKRIEGSLVHEIEQYDSDRIVVIKFSDFRLVIEMFGKGNLVLVGNDGKTALAYKSIEYRDRAVKARAVYLFPKSSFIEIEGLDQATAKYIAEAARDSEDKLIVALARTINVGPIYLEDIIRRCGLEPNGKLHADDDVHALEHEILRFSKELSSYKARSYAVEGGREYSVLHLLKFKDMPTTEYDSLCALLDELHVASRTAVDDSAKSKALTEVDANIQKQRALADGLANDSISYSSMGNKIFERMDDINALVEYMRRNKKADVKELEREFPGLGVKSVDLKNKTVAISVE